MTRIRRTRFVAFVSTDEPALDIGRLLHGEAALERLPRTYALSVLTGDRSPLEDDELALALAVPETWTEAEDILAGRANDVDSLQRLARAGVLVTDDPDPELAELRRRDEGLAGDHWSPQAALYHFGTKWRDVRVELEPAGGLDALGPPPPHFAPARAGVEPVPLPDGMPSGELHAVLRRRRTARAFDDTRRIRADELATVLGSVWGCHAFAELGPGVVMLRRTSPSGGGLHPTEVYPLIRNVEGIAPGLYHYSVRDHTLEPIVGLEPDEVKAAAFDFTAGQPYFEGAHVLFVMTARFDRCFWKYRDHPRAYGVILMDAGHLSQTFYLVCTGLRLGAFVTAAINGANIEQRLGLDGFREGAIAVCGCGPSAPAPPELEPVFAPYPR